MTTAEGEPVDSSVLGYLWAPELDPLFWPEARAGVLSAWYGHVPFAHWIVCAVMPRTLVELGTHNGVSYSAFCEAVVRNGFDTRCYAVDTWRGDDQTGRYGDEVYSDLQRFNEKSYGAFSQLLRCTFDEALPYFSERSIDLLHIDGFHTYEAVRNDFEHWRPKLSDSGVVLLHDTNVRERSFGVWRLWEELRVRFPSFEFLHGHGLGVLAVGNSVPAQITALCSLDDPTRVNAIRQRFSRPGDLLAQREFLQNVQIPERDTRIRSLEAEAARLKAEADARIRSLEAALAQVKDEAARRSAAEERLRARAAHRTAQARALVSDVLARPAGSEGGATPLVTPPEPSVTTNSMEEQVSGC
jgi:O-antigen biosynthesis protein